MSSLQVPVDLKSQPVRLHSQRAMITTHLVPAGHAKAGPSGEHEDFRVGVVVVTVGTILFLAAAIRVTGEQLCTRVDISSCPGARWLLQSQQ